MTIEPLKPVKFRHELKHRINPREDSVLSQRLCKLFPRDKHAGSDGTYMVTSLYFDTPYDSALKEKSDGISRREKFRIRYYGTNTSFIKLEKKFKVNGMCGKHSAVITAEQVRELLAGRHEFLLELDNALFFEFYSKLKGKLLEPKTIVRYDREAYTYAPGNVRITLDRNIRSGLWSRDFLNPDIFYLSVGESCTVVEVKYDAFLPELVKKAVLVPGRQAQACSKYALCRRFD